MNETYNYTFTELSRYRQYTLFINGTNGAANYTASLDAMTLMETGVFSKWLFIGFMGLLIILLYFYLSLNIKSKKSIKVLEFLIIFITFS
jgi:hypothetical protein